MSTSEASVAVAAPVAPLSEDDTLVPIRMVEAVIYCPRQAWYRFVGGDDPLNLHMERGLRRHATLDTAPSPVVEGETFRHLAVIAPVFGVTGVLDEVTITDTEVIVTEYKATRARAAVWEGTAVQLAVQHLALREHGAGPHWHGPPLPAETTLRVYESDSRRYRALPWTPELAARAQATVAEARRVLAQSVPPPGVNDARCRNCQHEPICLPNLLPLLVEYTPGEGETP